MANGSAEKGARQSYDWQKIHPCVAVIETIELYDETHGTSNGLEQPLAMYFNVDALDNLFPTELRMAVSFDIEDYTVTIHDNTVSVSAAEANHPDS